MSQSSSALPRIVSEAEWRQARDALLTREKELTHARDALAAKRRRLPMVKVETHYVFEDPGGQPSLLDLFAGRGGFVCIAVITRYNLTHEAASASCRQFLGRAHTQGHTGGVGSGRGR